MKFQPGTYYVGDPCYVIADDKWDEFLEPYWATCGGEFMFAGHQVAAYSTAHGDGVYFDQDGNQYGVDAGMIGVIPMELVTKRSAAEVQKLQLGAFIEFKEPFSTEEDGGTIIIGHVEIPTDYMEEEDD